MKLEDKYRLMSDIEHVLELPDMYIGSRHPQTISTTINGVDTVVTYSPGLIKLFDEIIINAIDESTRDPTLTTIAITIDQSTGPMGNAGATHVGRIGVKNNGTGMDVVKHPTYKVWIPSLVFGTLRTSTNYKQAERKTAGIHGLGAKLTAIFSKTFTITTHDAKRHKTFQQTFSDNLKHKSTPTIVTETTSGYCDIQYIPDYAYFGYTNLTPDNYTMMRQRVDHVAALYPHLAFSVNGTPVQMSFKTLVESYTVNQPVVHACTKGNYISLAWNPTGSFKHTAFVNGTFTINGGVHVKVTMEHLATGLQKMLKKAHPQLKAKPQTIMNHFWLFLGLRVTNPSFSSQSKNELVSGHFDLPIPKAFSKDIHAELFQRLVDSLQAKQAVQLSKTDGKTKKIKRIPKLEDAHWAGTHKSHLCTLILTEGDSAMTMALSGLSGVPHGRKQMGVFPLKGKPLNVRDAPVKTILNNQELNNIKKILGLQTNKQYTNTSELRYGSILLMMDADTDGSHIKGLIFNMIGHFWPSLLQIPNFIRVLMTPVIKVTTNITNAFYSIDHYNAWKKTNQTPIVKIKYYKGLGTSTALEAKDYFANLDKNTVVLKWSENCLEALLLAFAKSNADKRKAWLNDAVDKHADPVHYDKNTTYYEFVHNELIQYSIGDNVRSIPDIMDGLKPSQRKVLYATLKKNSTKEIKVSQLVGYVGEQTQYHHGEASLINVIINMAQNYCGSNNINLLEPLGQFGSRRLGGKDHSSARYIFTKLHPMVSKIFIKDDEPCLSWLVDEGIQIEPKRYMPVIPMVLINGADGIGTGYSTDIPQFHPTDIINELLAALKTPRYKFKSLTPHYRNHAGKIIKVSDNQYLSTGIFSIDKHKLIITELPVKVWTEDYLTMLNDLAAKDKRIRKIQNNSTDLDIEIVMTCDPDLFNVPELDKYLKLTKTINLTNMNLYCNGKIVKFTNTAHIMKTFFTKKLAFYQKRKNYLLDKYKQDLLVLQSKEKFIKIVHALQLSKLSSTDIDILLTKRGLWRSPINGFEYLLNMPFSSMSKTNMVALKAKIQSLQAKEQLLAASTCQDLYRTDLLHLQQVIK